MDGEPTSENPLPTLKLGYHSSPRARKLTEKSTRRILNYSATSSSTSVIATSAIATPATLPIIDDTPVLPLSSPPDIQSPTSPLSCMEISPVVTSTPHGSKEIINLKEEIKILKTTKLYLLNQNKKLQQQQSVSEIEKKLLGKRIQQQNNIIRKLTTKNKSCHCKIPYNQKVLVSDSKCEFYTGIQTLAMFNKLHDIVKPYVKRRWRGLKLTTSHKTSSKKFGPKRKLPSKDEFLLTLMKLRLGLLNEDLADRFKISKGLTSTIFLTWIKASSLVLAPLIYMPEQESISNTRPSRFKSMPDLHSIIDGGTEFFIQTPKNPEMQKLTWSEYKHHNTLKALVCVSKFHDHICIKILWRFYFR